jgi:hypothetical protein
MSLQKFINPNDVLRKFNKYTNKIEWRHGVDYPETNKHCNIDSNKIWETKIDAYVKRINKLGMFNLVFKKWDECDKPFYVKYSSVENNCFISTNQGLLYKNLNE